MSVKDRDETLGVVPLIIADIYQLAGQLRRNADAIARAIGQTQARWQVLSAASADSKTVPQIARRLGIARQNVQRIADLLIAEGLATLQPNPDHKTSPFLVLTECGRSTFAQLMRHARAYYRELASELSGTELAVLRRSLRRFCDALDKREADLESDD
ncbi:MAG TPA: MarR family winged helix-turn-helix transcriptional regulator [Stellaceae bacterium]|jgi:DNA-binding MarR family transcriptional regulator